MFCERGGWGGGGVWERGREFWTREKFFYMIFFHLLFPCTDIFLILRTTPAPPPITWLFSSDLSLRYTELWQKRPNNQNILYCVLEPKVFNKSTQFKSSAIRTVNNFALLFLTVRSKQSRIRGPSGRKYTSAASFFPRLFSDCFSFFFFFTDLIGGTDVLSLALWLASLNVNDSYCWQHWSSYFWSYEQAARLREAIFKIACYSRPIWILNIIPGD